MNSKANIVLSDANARALGFAANPAGGIDSTIGLNISEFNLNRTNINFSHYDLIGSSSHEMDKVLGISSGLDNFNAGVALSKTSVAAEDNSFRYDLLSVLSQLHHQFWRRRGGVFLSMAERRRSPALESKPKGAISMTGTAPAPRPRRCRMRTGRPAPRPTSAPS